MLQPDQRARVAELTAYPPYPLKAGEASCQNVSPAFFDSGSVGERCSMKKVWMHKNGTSRDSAPLGIPLPVGTPTLGGPIVTAGGVAFMSGTLDYYLRAYDLQNGRELWKGRLPAGGQATPITYVSEKTGKQYVVQMAGGHGSFGTRLGDSLIAWTLEEEAR
ncbi:glucose dehydrogenase [Stutzerimonas stutzeri KOS6]|uniref:Glucose dehydrogenase n=1 Tax=Stutzerimonas stutzeri KOS6 TaxID=1218352 RepID=A0A061JN16_STUST|nr:glucose dehydrogenase [Stutzerimonas stutzeri KOS6]